MLDGSAERHATRDELAQHTAQVGDVAGAVRNVRIVRHEPDRRGDHLLAARERFQERHRAAFVERRHEHVVDRVVELRHALRRMALGGSGPSLAGEVPFDPRLVHDRSHEGLALAAGRVRAPDDGDAYDRAIGVEIDPGRDLVHVAHTRRTETLGVHARHADYRQLALEGNTMRSTRPNLAGAVDAPIASLFVSVRCGLRATDHRR